MTLTDFFLPLQGLPRRTCILQESHPHSSQLPSRCAARSRPLLCKTQQSGQGKAGFRTSSGPRPQLRRGTSGLGRARSQHEETRKY